MPPRRIATIADYHRLRGLPPPQHALVSLVRIDDAFQPAAPGLHRYTFGYYLIALKRGVTAKMRYGQQQHDFDGGILFFVAPGQVFGLEIDDGYVKPSGWMLLVHPDLLWGHPLAERIATYEFWTYRINEALFLSAEEETRLDGLVAAIEEEYRQPPDGSSHGIILAQLETLLQYADRFYQRMFSMRRPGHHHLSERLEAILNERLSDRQLYDKGIPTVQDLADTLHVSPSYLRKVLIDLTGKTTQEILQEKIIDRAKEMLSTTTLSVSEIAYRLGFAYPQSLSKLFKAKTRQTPLGFRSGFS